LNGLVGDNDHKEVVDNASEPAIEAILNAQNEFQLDVVPILKLVKSVERDSTALGWDGMG